MESVQAASCKSIPNDLQLTGHKCFDFHMRSSSNVAFKHNLQRERTHRSIHKNRNSPTHSCGPSVTVLQYL